jgi:hypothetical protein
VLLEWAGSYLRLRKVPGEKPAPATGNPMKRMLSQNGFRWLSLWFNDPAAVGERRGKAGYPAPMKGANVSMTRDPENNVVEIMGVPPWDVFREVSKKMGMRNEDAYNRHPCFGDVNRDGWFDIAIGWDNIKAAWGGFLIAGGMCRRIKAAGTMAAVVSSRSGTGSGWNQGRVRQDVRAVGIEIGIGGRHPSVD